MRMRVLYFFLISMVFVSCKPDTELVYEKVQIASDTGIHQMDTLLLDPESKQLISRLEKANSPGMYSSYPLPESLQGQSFYIVYKGRVRSNFAQSRGQIVFTAYTENKEQLCWWTLPLSPHLVYQNQWNHFNDSIYLPGLVNENKYTLLHSFIYLANAQGEKLDIDTFHVLLKKINVD